MKKEDIIKLIKYVVGSVVAVLLAAALRLEFAYAARNYNASYNTGY